ncbi:YdcF family protein [Ammoniphilus resinae]|uniref:Uncharacterized SAM-binding protein YcdF (DUF218 family) n=1 Tax=Ammoniphilus resinae TaxID=861532 RepID=A0ABS4GVF1_9BACL|nr:YdcF family protein [Ammoniphilus resinae]MBP1934226.1 uncharacterized SAM-binding protein YcdF (DUF218 family) [Ammoniphilus resinae]
MKKKISLWLLAFCIAFVCYSGLSIWSYGSENQRARTDAAIVLGAAVWGNQPSPVFQERINHGIRLYTNGYVQKLIFTGGKGEANEFAESEVARLYALEHGVRDEDILIETESRITEENLKYAYKLAIEKGLQTFTIVSDPLHMKRAMTMAADFGMEAYSSPTQSTVYRSWQAKLPFFFRELFYYLLYLVSSPFR